MRRAAVVVALVLPSAVACSAQGTSRPAPGSSPQSASVTRSAGGSGTPTARSATLADNATSITLRVGTELRVTLPGHYWIFGAVAPGVLRGSTPFPVATRGSGTSRIPGSGAGSVVEVFHAVAPGAATITATRNSCGEARRCRPDEARFRLSVVVH